MENVQLDLESATAELTVKAFNTFVEDIAAMLDTTVTANQTDVSTGTVKDLKDRYQQLSAVCSVTAEGPVNGQFHVVFDRNGIFILPGTFIMQSEQVILENIKKGDEAAASEVADTLGEIGNLMVGAWDKVFREELEEHKHFVQTRTYIGDPWTDPQEKIHLNKDEKLSILTFEMTVDPFPAFKCSVLYPKSIFELPAEEPVPAEETQQQAEPQQEKGDEPAQEAEQPISETINKMTSSSAVLPGNVVDQNKILMKLTAADVMRTDLVWAGPDNTVEELVARMQQHDTAYLMIGEENKLEGIISKSDVRGALSPYLQSMFAKWRSSMDTATLQIKAKWVMSRPVRTVRPDATLKLVVQTMSEHGGRCMPVIDQQGKLQGLITVFDIFQVLLRSSNPNVSSIDKTPQGPPLT